MFIDEQSRTVQKHILDVLNDHTGGDAGQLHCEEVLRFRTAPYSAELSNFFYCRELKLKSWYLDARQPTSEQLQALWLDIVERCGASDIEAPTDFRPSTNISSLVQYLHLYIPIKNSV